MHAIKKWAPHLRRRQAIPSPMVMVTWHLNQIPTKCSFRVVLCFIASLHPVKCHSFQLQASKNPRLACLSSLLRVLCWTPTSIPKRWANMLHVQPVHGGFVGKNVGKGFWFSPRLINLLIHFDSRNGSRCVLKLTCLCGHSEEKCVRFYREKQ